MFFSFSTIGCVPPANLRIVAAQGGFNAKPRAGELGGLPFDAAIRSQKSSRNGFGCLNNSRIAMAKAPSAFVISRSRIKDSPPQNALRQSDKSYLPAQFSFPCRKSRLRRWHLSPLALHGAHSGYSLLTATSITMCTLYSNHSFPFCQVNRLFLYYDAAPPPIRMERAIFQGLCTAICAHAAPPWLFSGM